jgi:hypothetical protein
MEFIIKHSAIEWNGLIKKLSGKNKTETRMGQTKAAAKRLRIDFNGADC